MALMSEQQLQEDESPLVRLGRIIRNLRKSQGMTQAQLAEEIGVDESYVSKIEKGRLSYTPSEETLRLIAHTLEADTLELLAMAEKAPNELQMAVQSQQGREFFELVRGRRIESEDWKHLTRTLRRRLAIREKGRR